MTDRGAERKLDQALLWAKVVKKGDKENNNWRKGKFDKGKKCSNSKDKAKDEDKPETFKRGRGSVNNQKKKKDYDKRKIQC